jgi:histidinol phosphatase-like PHP family hydrolase
MNIRRIIGAFVALFAITVSAVAQKPNEVALSFARGRHRQEITIPQIAGYNVYKADFHTHTIYSDGTITPSWRVREAWFDGLDIIAITDHIEYRRVERELLKYMGQYIKEEYRGLAKGVNTNLQGSAADELGILSNLNVGYESAKECNEQYGLLIVRGVEITRNEGHFNAIFTKDNNKIYHPDIEQSIANAVKQGAFVFQNHPKHDKTTSSSMTPLAERVHEKGHVKGIELCNGPVMWSRLISYCLDNGYTPIANSDGHTTMAERYYPHYNNGCYRNMTLILAKECTEKAIKQALNEGRTIAYHNNKLIGKEEYLSELFKNSVSIEHMCDNKKETMVILTNKSSFPYQLKFGKRTAVVEGMGAVQLTLPKGAGEVEFVVTNLICGNGKRPKVAMTFERKPTNKYLEENPTWYPY